MIFNIIVLNVDMLSHGIMHSIFKKINSIGIIAKKGTTSNDKYLQVIDVSYIIIEYHIYPLLDIQTQW